MAEETQAAIAHTMAEARRVIDEEGLSEPALQLIQRQLRELARVPGLVEEVRLKELHGSTAAATVLGSEGADGLTLVLARFPAEAPTPVHDHGSWGVACVVTGHDRYIHWERLDGGSDPDRANIRVQYEKVLEPGDAVYWFDPPHDIHSQQGDGGEAAWELVLFGRDAMRTTRHYFDPETGRVRTASPN